MTLINADQLDTSPPDYLVDRMIPLIGAGFLYGPSYFAKSLVADQELGLAISNGTRFFGREVVQGNVVICLGEGQADAGVRKQGRLVREQQDRQARAAGIEAKRGPEAAAAWLASLPPYTDERLFVMPEAFAVPIGSGGEPTRALRQAANEIKQVADDLMLVILDSAADFTGGLSLANDTSANRFMLGMKWLVKELDCFILAIAHPSDKSSGKTGLPGSRLFNSSDFVAGVQPDLSTVLLDPDAVSATIIAEKVKSGKLFDPISYMTEGISWYEPARDRETGELIPGAPPVLVTSATVRQRDDEQSSTGGLRLPGAQPRPGALLPPAVPIPAKLRKRNGIRANAAPFRAVSPAPAPVQADTPDLAGLATAAFASPDPEAAVRASLVTALISVTCPACHAEPGASCAPGGSGIDYVVLGKMPLVIAHVERIGVAVAQGMASLDDVLARFDGDKAPAGQVMAGAQA
jgi:hypothetical protein